MRVSDLDRDHSQIFVCSEDPDSLYLFDRMQEALFEALGARPGDWVVDVAAGLGRDGRALAERGLRATSVEPSKLLTELQDLIAEREAWKDLGEQVTKVRAWGEALPFRRRTFAASFCKGSLDHFDDPLACLEEMARVTRSSGRVALAVANMEAAALRVERVLERLRPRRSGQPGRRHSDAPADHITRYDPALIREQAERFLHVEVWMGVSLFWGMRGWQSVLRRLSPDRARRWVRAADAVARRRPAWADLIVVAGRPRD